jgi:flavin reductase (DIM6/NTAB) family NADH-FMN oxidoreductase RutF
MDASTHPIAFHPLRPLGHDDLDNNKGDCRGPAQKKLALRAINYGLHIVTARHGEDYAAGGVNWLSQSSFDPPLVMVAIKVDSGADAIIGRSGAFAVNVLSGEQLDIATAFFRSTSVEDGLINGQAFTDGPATGSPLISATPYWWECRVTDTVERGDHTIFVGEVVEAGVRDSEAAPLLLRDTGMNYGG